MSRDFRIGLGVALLLHAGAVLWALALPAPAVSAPDLPSARAVAFTVSLPKPKAVPPAVPPPVAAVVPPPVPERPQPRTPPKQRRAAAPRAAPVQAQAAAQPAPLALSQVYAGAGAVVVERNDTDVLGDPAVPVSAASLAGKVGAPTPAEVAPAAVLEPLAQRAAAVVVRAAPRTSCPVAWPAGWASENRILNVRLLLTVDRDGRVSAAKVLRGAGAPFDQAAIDALQQCVFQPGLRNGQPVVDRVPFLVEFKPSDA
jgi:TonB family protein